MALRRPLGKALVNPLGEPLGGPDLPWDAGVGGRNVADPRDTLLAITSIHRLWWPSYGITQGAGPTVTSWLDSVADADLAAVNAPGVASVAGFSVPDFDGTDDHLGLTPGSTYNYLHDGTGGSMVAAIRWDGTTGTRVAFTTHNEGASGTGVSFSRTTSGNAVCQIGAGTGTWVADMASAGTPLAQGEGIVVLTLTYKTQADEDARFRVDGTEVDNATEGETPDTGNPTTFQMGAKENGTRPWDGPILALALFNDELTGADLAAAEDAFIGTWL